MKSFCLGQDKHSQIVPSKSEFSHFLKTSVNKMNLLALNLFFFLLCNLHFCKIRHQCSYMCQARRVTGYHPLHSTFEQSQLVSKFCTLLPSLFYKNPNLVSSILFQIPSFHLLCSEFSLICQSWTQYTMGGLAHPMSSSVNTSQNGTFSLFSSASFC